MFLSHAMKKDFAQVLLKLEEQTCVDARRSGWKTWCVPAHTPRVGTRAPSSIEDGASRGVSPNARNRRSRGNSMNIWIVTGKERGELSNSYRVFNSLTGQKVVVKKSADNSADPGFTQEPGGSEISADQKRVILRTINNWER